jgi:hypothetical protein
MRAIRFSMRGVLAATAAIAVALFGASLLPEGFWGYFLLFAILLPLAVGLDFALMRGFTAIASLVRRSLQSLRR